MSRDTLRGVGRRGGGGGGNAEDAPSSGPSQDVPSPGSASLDSGVSVALPSREGAREASGDGKVPAMVSTLFGNAPTDPLPGKAREQGTVQRRDVGRPVEVLRRAGAHQVAEMPAADAAAPRRVVPAAASPAEPGQLAVIPMPTHSLADRPPQTTRLPPIDRELEGGYDDPPEGDAHEDPEHSFLGRAAMGVAVAAGMSIVLFLIIRLYVQNGPGASGERRSRPAAYTAGSAARAWPARPSPTPLDPYAPASDRASLPPSPPPGPRDDPRNLPSDWQTSPEGSLPGELPEISPEPAPNLPPNQVQRIGASTADGSGSRNRSGLRGGTPVPAKNPTARMAEPPRPRPVSIESTRAVLGQPPAAPAGPISNPGSTAAQPSARNPILEPPPLSAPGSRSGAAPPAAAGAPGSRRGGYDPDSTLPLNLE